jgi:Holliday junction DNA helicase RuvA
MIGKLSGTLEMIATDHAIIDVGGVGYIVQASSSVLSNLPRAGEPVAMWIETVVREDSITLYGFREAAEKLWFRLLTSVQGVGAKVALAVLAVLGPEDIARAVMLGDVASVTRANGVGKKLAERIVNELKDKVPTLGGTSPALSMPVAAAPASGGRAPDAGMDAASALVNLGYNLSDASRAVLAATAQAGEGADVQVLIRTALKELAGTVGGR